MLYIDNESTKPLEPEIIISNDFKDDFDADNDNDNDEDEDDEYEEVNPPNHNKIDEEDDVLDEITLDDKMHTIKPEHETKSRFSRHSEINDDISIAHNISNDISKVINTDLLSTEVIVSAEVARINLTMQEFIHLKVGDKLPLANLPASVKLCVNGKYIAQGILVEINNRVGVKITHLLN